MCVSVCMCPVGLFPWRTLTKSSRPREMMSCSTSLMKPGPATNFKSRDHVCFRMDQPPRFQARFRGLVHGGEKIFTYRALEEAVG